MTRALALVLLAACGSSVEREPDVCLLATNMYREKAGVPPVDHSSELAAFAKEGAKVDFDSGAFTHFGTDGGGIALAEIQCAQQDGWIVQEGEDVDDVYIRCISSFYDEGPGGMHYAILTGDYAKVGCGSYEAEGKITIVADFAN